MICRKCASFSPFVHDVLLADMIARANPESRAGLTKDRAGYFSLESTIFYLIAKTALKSKGKKRQRVPCSSCAKF
jgi:hypothetical protein